MTTKLVKRSKLCSTYTVVYITIKTPIQLIKLLLEQFQSDYIKSDCTLDLAEMFFGGAKSQRAKKYVDEVFDHFDVDNSGELSYEGNMS